MSQVQTIAQCPAPEPLPAEEPFSFGDLALATHLVEGYARPIKRSAVAELRAAMAIN